MPHDRRTRRVLLAMVGLAGVAMSVGCMQSSQLRSSAGPLPEPSPAGGLHPVPGGATSATPPTPATAPGPSDRGGIVPVTRPTIHPGPNPGGPAANSSEGLPPANVDPSAAA